MDYWLKKIYIWPDVFSSWYFLTQKSCCIHHSGTSFLSLQWSLSAASRLSRVSSTRGSTSYLIPAHSSCFLFLLPETLVQEHHWTYLCVYLCEYIWWINSSERNVVFKMIIDAAELSSERLSWPLSVDLSACFCVLAGTGYYQTFHLGQALGAKWFPSWICISLIMMEVVHLFKYYWPFVCVCVLWPVCSLSL